MEQELGLENQQQLLTQEGDSLSLEGNDLVPVVTPLPYRPMIWVHTYDGEIANVLV